MIESQLFKNAIDGGFQVKLLYEGDHLLDFQRY